MNTVAKLFEFGSRDARLIADRHTDTVFPIARFASRGQVEKRREELAFNALMAAGLYPLPEKTPLSVRREVVLRCDGYTVEKIMFETRPGFWSTGNLYMPSRLEAPAPAILNVIGHWEKQRLTRAEDADYPQQLANFAKMGFVCLVTDMVGKVDSRQITHEYGRDEKELWCSNALGAQLWNNIRALDLLCGMPEVDENRIGMTGASGGGSQTLLLALVDERVKAAAPINMISLRMQGGCQCENAPGLRRDTENAEMCAMLAPRPLFLAGSTGDWTQCQETEEYPAVLEAYRHYGAEGNVWHYYQAAGHQYNARTRRQVYRFFAHYLMGKDVDWEEEAVPPFDTGVLTWFPQNDGGSGMEPRGDEAYFEAQKAERKRAVAALTADEKRRMLRWITGVCGARAVVADGFCEEAEGLKTERSVITSTRGEQIPFVRITPERWRGRTCLMLSGAGKDCVLSDEAKALLAEGCAVVSGDLFMTGEVEGSPRQIRGEHGQRYYTTFHYTDAAYQAQDVALLWQVARRGSGETELWAEGCAARAAAMALPLLEGVCKARLEGRALDISDYMKECFVPGIMLIGGLKGCLALSECPVTLF